MKDNIKEIKKKINEDYSKRFQQLFEYNFYSGGDIMDEADEEQEPSTTNGEPVDVSPQSQLPQEEVPQEQSSTETTPPTDGEEIDMEVPQNNDNDEFEDIEVDGDDNVLDVTDLTNAQEETSNEVAELDSKFDQFNQFAEKLTQALEKIVQKAEENESEIQAVKDEIIKRSPTPNEVLNIRSLDSQPYNVHISDYWKNKASTNPNYTITSDNDNSKEEEYVLYDTDGDTASDFEMYKSFNNNLRNLVGI